MREPLTNSLTHLLDLRQVVTDPVELITYELDAGLDQGRPDGAVFPESTEDVRRVVRWAAEHKVPLVARGAGTGLTGGTVPVQGGIIVEFARMDHILELDPVGRSAVVEPGVVNQTLDQQAKTYGLYFPPDPASGRSSTIGGNVAENAGGPHCFKYGVTTNYVTGLEVVLADGRSVHLGGRALDYPEYDSCGLLNGSEGTLGVITQVSVRLRRNPPGVRTLMAAFDSVEQAGAAVSGVIAAGLVPATMEMMDRKIMRIIEDYVPAGLPVEAGAALIIEVDGYPDSLDPQIEEVTGVLRQHKAYDLRIADTAEERDKIWFGRKSAAGAMSRLAPAYYLVDVTVPRSQLAATLADVNQICEARDLRVGYVFHAGDGNLHPLILMDPTDTEQVERVYRAGREIAKLCVPRDGSISGEHGVGIEKREYMPLMYSGAELAAMWDVKQVFDPEELLNPGKIFPTEMPEAERAPGKRPAGDVFTPATAEEAARGLAALSAADQSVYISGSPTHNSARSNDSSRPSARSDDSSRPSARSDDSSRPPPRSDDSSRPPPRSDDFSRSNDTAIRLSTEKLRGIKTYAPEDLYVTVGAGTPLDEVQSFLKRDRMQVPLASPWPEATVGGLVAANVNGPLRMRYGGVRDLVLCATVTLADGRVIRVGRPVVKNVAGYDLPKVLVGSHGTLGLIADVTLRFTPLPRAQRTLLVPVENLSQGLNWAGQVLPLALVASAVVLCTHQPSAIQPSNHLDNSPYLLAYTAEGLPEDVDAELDEVSAVLEQAGAPRPVEVNAPTGTALWAQFLNRPTDDALLVRAGLPPGDLADCVRAQAAMLDAGLFLLDMAAGFVYTVTTLSSTDDAQAWVEALRRPALEAGGYAVVLDAPDNLRGVLDWWGYQPESLGLMHDLKARWDPAGILGPNRWR